MIPPSNKLTQVYKLVQTDMTGRLWSVNSHLRGLGSEQLIEYSFNHQVFPNDKVRALFAFPNYKTAMKYVSLYRQTRNVKVLRCLAHNARVVGNDTIIRDFAVIEAIEKRFFGGSAIMVLCEWLIPLNFIKIPQKYLTGPQN